MNQLLLSIASHSLSPGQRWVIAVGGILRAANDESFALVAGTPFPRPRRPQSAPTVSTSCTSADFERRSNSRHRLQDLNSLVPRAGSPCRVSPDPTEVGA